MSDGWVEARPRHGFCVVKAEARVEDLGDLCCAAIEGDLIRVMLTIVGRVENNAMAYDALSVKDAESSVVEQGVTPVVERSS